ncbi:hypothetical protein ACDH70_11325 [Xanthomonas axonopodis pv. poinsettiicola]
MISTIPANVCQSLPFDVEGHVIAAGVFIRIARANASAIWLFSK